MKKIFASVLALVMVLALASTAMAAFSWNAGSSTTAESFASRYKIEVVKLANETGIIGTNKMVEAPGATAVNNASVYFFVRLTVSGSNVDDPDDVQKNAETNVSFTALEGTKLKGWKGNIQDLGNGVYYYSLNGASETGSTPTAKQVWLKLEEFGGNPNSVFSAATIEARVLDTATAKVNAKVSSERPLPADGKAEFKYGGYDITVYGKDFVVTGTENPNTIVFKDGSNSVTFTRDGNGKVTKAVAEGDANFADKLYTYLGFRGADVSDGKIYMTNGNLRAAFGFDYKGEASATWNANSTAIILDPAVGVGIPKTGDNTSVIGFALVMLAVVGAAVAVKKVKA